MRMPFDGFLFASRVMVAKEAHTSEAIKQLIVEAQGVDDDKWSVRLNLFCELRADCIFREQTYDKPTGGIITVTSELGEPIHKVATRGVKLWKEFDKFVISLLASLLVLISRLQSTLLAYEGEAGRLARRSQAVRYRSTQCRFPETLGSSLLSPSLFLFADLSYVSLERRRMERLAISPT